MALKIKDKFIKEDIVDENDNKIGELKFNPNDSRIMKLLTEAVKKCSDGLKEIDKIGNIDSLSSKKLENIEDFEKERETFEKIDKAYDIELRTVESVINNLSEVFGKDTIELFTKGTMDVNLVSPVIDFVVPYVKKERDKLTKKYKKNKNKNLNIME